MQGAAADSCQSLVTFGVAIATQRIPTHAVFRAQPQAALDAHARAAALEQENITLKKQLQQLREVLGVVRPGGAAGGEGASGGVAVGGGGGGAGAGARTARGGAAAGVGASVELGALQRYKAQAVQLQRQVALLSEELQVGV